VSWTNPKTWNVGEILTAANLNTHLRDNMAHLRNELDARGGVLGQNPIVRAWEPINRLGAPTGVTTTANIEYWVPVRITSETSIIKMGFYVQSGASGNVIAGVYDSASNVLRSTASTAVGAGVNLVSLTSALALTPGIYYAAAVFSAASVILDATRFTAAAATTQGSFALGTVTVVNGMTAALIWLSAD